MGRRLRENQEGKNAQSLLQMWLPTVEIQRYASNCNYTVNLLHSRFGIDNFNILEGPSDGFEMIHFFEESLQAIDHVGNPVLANRDVIVMATAAFTTEFSRKTSCA